MAEVPYKSGDVRSDDGTLAAGFRSWSIPISFQIEKLRPVEGMNPPLPTTS